MGWGPHGAQANCLSVSSDPSAPRVFDHMLPTSLLALLPAASGMLALGLDPAELIKNFGIIGAIVIVFAESGLLIGFFLPGDSLLFTLGLLRATNPEIVTWPIWLMCICLFAAAVLGDQVGYQFGNKVGASLFEREDSRLFKRKHLIKSQEFFDRHGPRTIVLARFVPIVRTFAPVVAGASSMEYRTFLKYNVVGGALWAVGITMAGWLLGRRFEWLGERIELLSLVIVGISVLPMAFEFLRHHRRKSQAPTP